MIRPWLGNTPQGLFHLALYSGLTFLSLASHAKAMLTNPGAVPPAAEPLPQVRPSVSQLALQTGWIVLA